MVIFFVCVVFEYCLNKNKFNPFGVYCQWSKLNFINRQPLAGEIKLSSQIDTTI